MVAIAVPILDERGRYSASLAFHGPAQRLTIDDAISRKKILLEAAQRMREVLFS
jgi:DNA-binding IclR family transcriptional regulator